ncbi:hypothetical protein NQZ68_026333 [Dissostichus eleginoides]|nr:hypothetical protein NQZ68_026333 [Dissostichus eleginoides]
MGLDQYQITELVLAEPLVRRTALCRYDLTARLDGGRLSAAPLGYEIWGDETLRTAWCPLWSSTLQHDVFCSRGCPPRMQQQRLSSQDAAAGRHSRGGCDGRTIRVKNPETPELKAVGVLQQRLSSQDAAAEAVLPGCSSRGCPPRMQQQGVTAENPEM